MVVDVWWVVGVVENVVDVWGVVGVVGNVVDAWWVWWEMCGAIDGTKPCLAQGSYVSAMDSAATVRAHLQNRASLAHLLLLP